MASNRKIYPVKGLSCAACAASVTKALQGCAGVKEAGVNLSSNRAWVVYDEKLSTPEDLAQAVSAAGFTLCIGKEDSLEAQDRAQRHEATLLLYHFLWATTATALVLLLNLLKASFQSTQMLSTIHLLLVAGVAGSGVLGAGWTFHRKAIQLLRHGNMNMDTLVSLSSGIAYLYSLVVSFLQLYCHTCLDWALYFSSSAMIVAFILLGRWLEGRAKGKAGKALRELIGLQPIEVMVLKGQELQSVPIEQVQQGDTIQVRAGERVAVDGCVAEGAGAVDESTITGESGPIFKEPGEKVYAGTMLQQGTLTIVTHLVGKSTILGQIVQHVEEAQSSKAPIQSLADKVASWFVPMVLTLALITFLTWWLFGGDEGLWRGIVSAITVLAVACPCALGLATPMAMTVAMGQMAKRQLLVQDATAIQKAAQVNEVIFDKTGTLTEGLPEVKEAQWLVPDEKQESTRQILYALELKSAHPLARAVCAWCEPCAPIPVEAFVDHPGLGISGVVAGDKYRVGSRTMMDKEAVSEGRLTPTLDAWRNTGSMVILMFDNRQPLLALRLADRIRTTAREAVSALGEMGIGSRMLSGDSSGAVAQVATHLGIRQSEGGLLPSDKQLRLEELQHNGRCVAMVGDGINDSQALASANVSIAIGTGAQTVMHLAQVTIMSSDLRMLPWFFAYSQRTMRIARQNLFWAFCYNTLAIPIAAGALYPWLGWLFDPMVAAIAMALSSVSVVSNSLRLASPKVKQA